MTDIAEQTSEPVAEASAEVTAAALRAALVADMREMTAAFHAFAAKIEHVAARAGRTAHLDEAAAAAERVFTAISLHVHEVIGGEPEQPQLALPAPDHVTS